jgi:hypothetical protein
LPLNNAQFRSAALISARYPFSAHFPIFRSL